MFPWKVEKKPATPAEEKLEQIRQLLFPPLQLETDLDKNGDPVKYHIDRSIDTNIDAVIADLQEGFNDEACHKTLNSCIKTLSKVRNILQAYMELDKDAQYIIVENNKDGPDVEDIE